MKLPSPFNSDYRTKMLSFGMISSYHNNLAIPQFLTYYTVYEILTLLYHSFWCFVAELLYSQSNWSHDH